VTAKNMRGRARFACLVAMLSLLAASLGMPAVASAAPYSGPTSATIDAKKAQESAARQQLTRMRMDLGQAIAEFVAVGRQIQVTRDEISQTATETLVLAESLRVQHQVWRITPVAHSHHHIGGKPAIVPLLFRHGLQVDGMHIDPEVIETAVEQVALCRQSGRLRGVFVKQQHLHASASCARSQAVNVVGSLKQ
jgi:hypothetical protein